MAFSLGSLTETFNKLASSLGSIGAKDSDSVLGVDIGTSSIKAVQLKLQKGSAVLETYGEIALGPYANAEVGQSVNPPLDKLGAALKDLVTEANATARTGGFSVPLSASLINVINLPTKNRSDLASMIPIEARKYIPVPITEVSLDWFVIPEEEAQFLSLNGPEGAKAGKPANTTDVLLVAIQNQMLTKFQSVTEAAALRPLFYEVEPFSMGRASYEHTTAPAMIIDLGASATRVYIIEFGIIAISHTIGRGGQDLTLALAKSKGASFKEAEAEKREKGMQTSETGSAALDFIFAEARRIFLAYQRKEGKAISQVVLLGGGACLKGLETVAARYFDATIVRGTPFKKVSAPAFIEDVLKSAGPTFASAIGLALRALQA